MSSQASAHHRPFLNAAEAETTADLGALRETLSKAVHEAEVLGLPEVREHLDAALARVVEEHEGNAEA